MAKSYWACLFRANKRSSVVGAVHRTQSGRYEWYVGYPNERPRGQFNILTSARAEGVSGTLDEARWDAEAAMSGPDGDDVPGEWVCGGS